MPLHLKTGDGDLGFTDEMRMTHLRHTSTILENICWTQTAYAVLCQPHHTDTLFLLNNDLNEVIIFIFFAYKKYSRRFKVQIEPLMADGLF